MARSSVTPLALVPYPNPREAPADEASPIRLQDQSREAEAVQKKLPEYEYRSTQGHHRTPHEVRRIVIVKEHLDDDAEEPADLRHW